MKKILTLFITCILLSTANAQTPSVKEVLVAIDHVPIVVADLDGTAKMLSETLGFKIKKGKEHQGIKNCFVKFPDGTYLEFITPVDSTIEIGKYYTHALKKRQGGTELAVSVSSAQAIKQHLQKQGLLFDADENNVWKTVSPQGIDLFFIDYANKEWRDTKENTTHGNSALALQATYILSVNVNGDANRYGQYGFHKTLNGKFLNVPYTRLTAGKSVLYLLDASHANSLVSRFQSKEINGIAGFEIQVSSLTRLNKHLAPLEGVIFEPERTICFLKAYNLFLVFSE